MEGNTPKKKKAPVGRPTKIEAVQAALIAHVENGHTIATTARLLGISPWTIHEWCKKGRRSNSGKYYQFHINLTAAKARYIDKNLTIVNQAASGFDVEVRKEQQEYRRIKEKDANGKTVRDDEGEIVYRYEWIVVAREVVIKREFHPDLAKYALQCKEREEWGPDRYELAALKKQILELSKKVAELTAKPGEDA